jgi:hypothetical protein
MRMLIIVIGLIGAILFGSAFVVSYVQPIVIESVAKEIVRHEVEKRVGEKIASLDGGKLSGFASRIMGNNNAQINEAKQQIANGLPQKIAAVVAEMGDVSCECRKLIETVVGRGLDSQITSLGKLNERLTAFIRTKYREVAASLIREFRIFTGANALVFAFLAALAFFRRGASLQLAIPAIVLLGASFTVGTLYLFGQNWLHTIIFSEYIGLGYFAYLGVAIAFLADVALNRARVSSRILNGILGSLGSTTIVLPC